MHSYDHLGADFGTFAIPSALLYNTGSSFISLQSRKAERQKDASQLISVEDQITLGHVSVLELKALN